MYYFNHIYKQIDQVWGIICSYHKTLVGVYNFIMTNGISNLP